MDVPHNPFPQLADVAALSERRDLWKKVAECLAHSSEKHPMRDGGLTQDEVKRRVNFCIDFATVMIRERKWTVSRTCDHLWPSLESKLTSRLVVLSDRAFYPVDEMQ